MTVESVSTREEATPWTLRAVLMVGALALVAESTDGPGGVYPFATTVVGPRASLTADAPDARYRVIVRVTGTAPNGRSTTTSATGQLLGSISSAGVDDPPLVAVSVSRDGVTADAELSAANSFGIAFDPVFEGSCEKLSEAEPCTSTFFFDLARGDGGDRGGSVDVSLRLVFRSTVKKDEAPDAPENTLPWTVEFVRE